MTPLHPVLARVTDQIRARSRPTRGDYLARMESAGRNSVERSRLDCANLAHGFAACHADDKERLRTEASANIGIVTAYNDMLSAHQPFERFPALIRAAARDAGATAQVAGGVPAMCDGVTQGRPGMELSLFSRDTIAMATGIALSHGMFDAVLCLGVCDKIVPGLLIGALAFGHLPVIFVPAGPMPSGQSNSEKAKVRELHAAGKVGQAELLASESASYHGPGTCTFYGTANSNQMLMEFMGLHLPGASFVPPNTPLRDALTAAATRRAAELASFGPEPTPLAAILDERAIVNGIVGLMATGGSTNHTIHLIAIAAAAGMVVTWDDFAALSAVVPLLARIYPNGTADVNHFHAGGGLAVLIGTLLDAGLLHADVPTIAGPGLDRYRAEPILDAEGGITWHPVPAARRDPTVLASIDSPFNPDGGLRLLTGNLGRAVIKISAVKPEHRSVTAPARIFDSQEQFLAAFKAGELHRDFVAVLCFQGPRANGMPELHKLTPALGVLQGLGFHVALVTDGRMSGASGKVPAAIHVTPESADDGPLAKLRDGDPIRLDAQAGILNAELDDAIWLARSPRKADLSGNEHGFGRELFALFRQSVGGAENGASVFRGPLGVTEREMAVEIAR